MANDLNALVPATFLVTFPATSSGVPQAALTTVSVTLASLSLPDFAGAVGFPGTKVLHSSATAGGANGAELTALVVQSATDWYRWQAGRLDVKFIGSVPWDQDALSDLVEWRHAGGEVSTRVRRGVFRDDLSEVLQHGSAGSQAGAIPPLVRGTWPIVNSTILTSSVTETNYGLTQTYNSTSQVEYQGTPVNLTSSSTWTVSTGQTWTVTGPATSTLTISIPTLTITSAVVSLPTGTTVGGNLLVTQTGATAGRVPVWGTVPNLINSPLYVSSTNVGVGGPPLANPLDVYGSLGLTPAGAVSIYWTLDLPSNVFRIRATFPGNNSSYLLLDDGNQYLSIPTSMSYAVGTTPGITTTGAGGLAVTKGIVTGSATTTGTGAAVQTTAPTVTDATINQTADGDVAITSVRATDSSPTGSFEKFKTHAGSTLWDVGVDGKLKTGTVDGGTW